MEGKIYLSKTEVKKMLEEYFKHEFGEVVEIDFKTETFTEGMQWDSYQTNKTTFIATQEIDFCGVKKKLVNEFDEDECKKYLNVILSNNNIKLKYLNFDNGSNFQGVSTVIDTKQRVRRG